MKHSPLVALLCIAFALPSRADETAPVESKTLLKELCDADKQQRGRICDEILRRKEACLVPALEAYKAGLLELEGGQFVIYQSRVEIRGKGNVYPLVDAFTLEPLFDTDGAPRYAERLGRMLKVPRGERRRISELVSALSLLDPDPARRRQAIIDAGDRADATVLAQLQQQLHDNPSGPFAYVLREATARIHLMHGRRDEKLAAATALGELASTRSAQHLAQAREAAQDDAELTAALDTALASVARYQRKINFVHHTFSGLSLASILILLALGLSIIFGLMGVINMAHGEFMMIGAYTAFVVSGWFRQHLPGAFDWYFPVALPAAFLVAGFVGWVCEVVVIRRLYGRPLETLLATWGISLILIQAVRVTFGDTTAITAPSWLTGGWEVAPGLVLPWNRLFIIGFCTACIATVYFVINRTRFGLRLRATTQNREMAMALGVATRRVDGLTFAFGAGLAGLAGCAVILFDKLNPQMGQTYIVDSFMVVVVGGVGKLAGVIVAGCGLGFLSKYIEPWLQVIYGKVLLLALIVVFLQWRPSGLFPARGRLADA